MKRLFLISASLLLASATFAQDNELYKFNDAASPKTVRKLGSAPEFPYLMNLSSARQVYNAIKQHDNDVTKAAQKLNALLVEIGYANGAKDLEPTDITEAHVPVGTEGNMGSRGYTYGYYRLEGNASEFKAWKIAPNNNGNPNGSLYLFAKCGNAFFPKDGVRTACISVPVTVTPDVQQVTLNNSGTEVMTTDKMYVYYERRRGKKGDATYPVAGIDAKYPSKPLRVSFDKEVNVVPETYTVSLTPKDNTVNACAGKPLDIAANVNVEKTSTYTGNYPKSDHKVYKKVSKRHYKMIARKMRKAERKADKIARRTGVPVEVRRVATL